MSVNLSKLDNLSDLQLNESVFNGNIIDNAVNITLTNIGDIYSYTIFFITFIYLFYEFYRRDGLIMYDLARSINLSSGITLIFAIIMTAIGYSSNYKPVVIFGFIFMFSLYAVYKSKQQ